MSDMADQYYLAWISVFDGTPRKLLCTWHVDRAWRGALQQHVKGVERQVAVYSQLRVRLEELELDKFTTFIDKVHFTGKYFIGIILSHLNYLYPSIYCIRFRLN